MPEVKSRIEYDVWSQKAEIGGLKSEDSERSYWLAYDAYVVKHGHRPPALLIHPDTLASWEKHGITFPADLDPVPIVPSEMVTRGQIWLLTTIDGEAVTQAALFAFTQEITDHARQDEAADDRREADLQPEEEGEEPRPAGAAEAEGTAEKRSRRAKKD